MRQQTGYTAPGSTFAFERVPAAVKVAVKGAVEPETVRQGRALDRAEGPAGRPARAGARAPFVLEGPATLCRVRAPFLLECEA